MRNLFGETKLGIVSTILSIAGALLVGVGSIGATLNTNALLKKEVAEAAERIVQETV